MWSLLSPFCRIVLTERMAQLPPTVARLCALTLCLGQGVRPGWRVTPCSKWYQQSCVSLPTWGFASGSAAKWVHLGLLVRTCQHKDLVLATTLSRGRAKDFEEPLCPSSYQVGSTDHSRKAFFLCLLHCSAWVQHSSPPLLRPAPLPRPDMHALPSPTTQCPALQELMVLGLGASTSLGCYCCGLPCSYNPDDIDSSAPCAGRGWAGPISPQSYTILCTSCHHRHGLEEERDDKEKVASPEPSQKEKNSYLLRNPLDQDLC